MRRSRRADSFDAHKIPLNHPEEDIHDTDHYSVYRLCYDSGGGTNECRQAIEPQPEIGEIHPEARDPKLKPYNLLLRNLDGMKREIGTDKARYLVVKLWMQENREPTDQEKRLFEEKWNREQRGLPQTAVVIDPEASDYRFRRELPTNDFTLKYRFVENGEKSLFEATPETRDTIKVIGQAITALQK